MEKLIRGQRSKINGLYDDTIAKPKDFDDFDSSDILQDVVEEIAKRGDEAIFTAFEKYGYSKDYLVSHADEFLVEYWPSIDSKTFYHCDEKLFTIYKITDVTQSSMYSFSYQLDFYVVYHKDLRKENT